jgi:hypothetical protein
MAGATVAFAVATLTAAPAATANSMTDWSARAQHAIVDVAQQRPWNQTRSFAIVSAAAYDAVNAIDGMPYRPYLVAPPARRRHTMCSWASFPRSGRLWTSSTTRL